MNEAARNFVDDLLADGYTVTRMKYSHERLLLHFDVSKTKGLTDLRKATLLWLLDYGRIMSVELNEKELVMLFFHKVDKPMTPFPASTYTTGII